jgi:hypothetical protein
MNEPHLRERAGNFAEECIVHVLTQKIDGGNDDDR